MFSQSGVTKTKLVFEPLRHSGCYMSRMF